MIRSVFSDPVLRYMEEQTISPKVKQSSVRLSTVVSGGVVRFRGHLHRTSLKLGENKRLVWVI